MLLKTSWCTQFFVYCSIGLQLHRIKKAYRRKALELHPDRNYGKEEDATKLFAEIQAAHEVLSDPQERAWYDSHESQILHGTQGGTEDHYEHNVRVTTAEDIAAMLGNFHGRIDFSDSPTGFYGFLRETFEKLAREEEAAADWEGLDIPEYPPFGHKEDAYEDVVKEFYAGWAGFSTKKTFSWRDAHRYTDAPDRRIRRLMEKENKKLRDDGIREFNDAVRTLVAFVRKRDPRYLPNTQSSEDRQKAMRDASAAQAAKARAANATKLAEAVPEWTKARDMDESEEEEEEDVDDEEFECVACHKTFKSEKQFEAHERSKKHQKSVQALKRQMYKDNKNFHLDDDTENRGISTARSLEGEGEEDMPDVAALEINDDDLSEKDPFEDEEAPFEGEEESEAEVDPFEEQPEESMKTGATSDPIVLSRSASDSEDSDYASEAAIVDRLANPTPLDSTLPDEAKAEDVDTAPAGPKLGKAAQKRQKRAAKEAQTSESDSKFKCAKCSAAFPSKTQLFQHINDLGHAAPVPQKTVGKKRKNTK
jgi:DnaJ family protein A protein 5